MKPRHQLSRAAIELIKRFEGYREHAAQLPDGRWTIGYGHTLTARQGAQVSEADAEALLFYDLIRIARAVNDETFAVLNQNQFDALCAFAFSIGLDNFRHSEVLRRVNEGAFAQAAFGLELWRKSDFEGERIVVDALVRRRAAEKLLFLTPADGVWPPAPSPLLKPLLDLEAVDTAPRETPASVVAEASGQQLRARREEPPSPPEAEVEPKSPVTAAAESVAARLQALFPDPEPGVAPPPAATEAPADPAPSAVAEPPEPAAVERLVASEPEPRPAPEITATSEVPAAAAAPPAPQPEQPARRILIDDTAPYEFLPAPVQPLPAQSADGVLSIVFLAILGLAFFAGGVFWGLNAPPARPGVLLSPLIVGWLAGLAGVALLGAAVFLFLNRLGRAAERGRDRSRI